MVHTIIAHFHARPESAQEIKDILQEGAALYVKDKGTIDWYVMHDHEDSTKFYAVERYESRAAVDVHINNPFFKHFCDFVGPRLVAPMTITQTEEF
ncbi:hypothetical protein IAR50_002212 [Cryptococcus sp. DSM 104548]